jgi:ribosomal protein L31E
MFLTEEELHQLTGKVQYSAQIRVLNAMGFDHKRRADGAVLVLRSHVEAQMGGGSPARKTAAR